MAGVLLVACGSSGDPKAKSASNTEVAATAAATAAPTTERPTTAERPTTTAPVPTSTIPRPTTTVRPTTTAATTRGTRENPFTGTALTFGDWDNLSVSGLGPIDLSVIVGANQFNNPPPPGQQYVAMIVIATYTGAGVGSPSSLGFSLRLVGAKNKVYDYTIISDSSDNKALSLLSDQPDVIQGGTVSGAAYYLVDADDSGFMVVVNGTNGPQFVTPV